MTDAAVTRKSRGWSRSTRLFYRLFRFGPFMALRRWFKHLPSSDQRALSIVAIFLLAVGLYLLVWQPLRGAARDAENYYAGRHELLAWVEQHADEVRELQGKRGSEETQQLAGQSLLSVVTNTAKERKLELKRFEPRGENAVNIWLEGVAFNTLIEWLDQMREKHAINITQIAVDREPTKPGQVIVKLSLAS